jgi:hypothetical protein
VLRRSISNVKGIGELLEKLCQEESNKICASNGIVFYGNP